MRTGGAKVSAPWCPTDAEVDAVLVEFGGEAREAIRALLAESATLAAEYEAAVSPGYTRSGGAGSPAARGQRTEGG